MSMLCVKCGVEVEEGSVICDACAQEQPEPPSTPPPPAAEEATPKAAVEQPVDRPVPIKTQSAAPRMKWFVLAMLVCALAVLVKFAAPGMFSGGIGGAAGPEQPAADPEPVQTQAAPTAQPTPAAPELPAQPTIASGYIRIDTQNVSVADAIALYHPLQDKIEIGFYKERVISSVRKQALTAASLVELGGSRADIIFEIVLRRGVTLCNPAQVLSFDAHTSAVNLGRALEFKFGKDAGGISELSCHLTANGQISVGLAQSMARKVEAKSKNPDAETKIETRWELRVSGPILISAAPARFHFNSADRRPVVFWNKAANTVEAGYFNKPVREEDYAKIRAESSLTALSHNKPVVSVSFEMKDEFTSFSSESIRGYGVHFYRSEEPGGLLFPGERDKVSFFFAQTTKQSEELEAVSGHLNEGDPVRARLKNAAEKKFGENSFIFSWEISLVGLVMDTQSEPLVTFALDPMASQISGPPKSTGGEVQVGKAIAELKDAVAMYFPAENDLVVGYYQEPLTPAERTKILTQQSIWNQVNGRLPTLVVIFNLKPGSTSISKDSVLQYRLIFLRDKLGQFYFPGPTDRATIKKLAEEITDAQVPYLGGNVKEGKTVAFILQGEYVSNTSQLAFRWKAEATIPVVVAK